VDIRLAAVTEGAGSAVTAVGDGQLPTSKTLRPAAAQKRPTALPK
jgi:hypothetical protein